MQVLIESDGVFSPNSSMLRKIAESLGIEKDVELVIVDSVTMRQINLHTRGSDKATDVLSFPLEDVPGASLGSIVINVDAVEAAAKEYGHTPQEEFALLFIHGLLHLLGYDHEIDEGQMRKKEKELIEQFDLPPSLIIRNEG